MASAAELGKACELARTATIDFALLDLNLDGQSAAPVAHILQERRVPFVFSTGYGASGLSAEFTSYATLSKPFVANDLQDTVVRALNAVQPRY